MIFFESWWYPENMDLASPSLSQLPVLFPYLLSVYPCKLYVNVSISLSIIPKNCWGCVRHLSTLENHTREASYWNGRAKPLNDHLRESHPKSCYWSGRAKPLNDHIGHPILTNVELRHSITTLIPTYHIAIDFVPECSIFCFLDNISGGEDRRC